jgi:V8-like Glu-specific endopeptidase
MFDKRITQLIDALSGLIIFPNDTLPFLSAAHISPRSINLNGGSLAFWYNIVKFADDNRQLNDLVDALLKEYPKNPHLLAFKEATLQDYNLGPDIRKDVQWKNGFNEETKEKITGDQSTLLPIRFLAIGLEKAKSVARVAIQRASRVELGTGFLTSNNLLVTNNHVINDLQTAAIAKIQFNYEETIGGNPVEPTLFSFDPSSGFATCKEDDWTAVRIKEDANKDFGALELQEATISKGDFVNIIQHPAGRFKEIGLYHNIITYCDNRVVQYLTDTEPGSSGSPVFNSDWEVVALHHSGGNLREPNTELKLLRNEGINIQKVIKGIKENRL